MCRASTSAVRTPTSTYHFAPLILALVLPFASRSSPIGHSRRPVGAFIASIGGVLAALIGLGLAWTGNLEGPTLWGEGGALVEVLTFSAVGVLIGNALLLRG
ncbi:MAG: hypothetical protein QNM02_07660 [Acidimicrobiia bacterium]|nr:hypothetical protein [Acidimicrobiia bacterium]